MKPPKISQSRKKRQAAGRTSVAFWLDADDLYRIDYLSKEWGLVWKRDVVREALRLAFKDWSQAK